MNKCFIVKYSEEKDVRECVEISDPYVGLLQDFISPVIDN